MFKRRDFITKAAAVGCVAAVPVLPAVKSKRGAVVYALGLRVPKWKSKSAHERMVRVLLVAFDQYIEYVTGLPDWRTNKKIYWRVKPTIEAFPHKEFTDYKVHARFAVV